MKVQTNVLATSQLPRIRTLNSTIRVSEYVFHKALSSDQTEDRISKNARRFSFASTQTLILALSDISSWSK